MPKQIAFTLTLCLLFAAAPAHAEFMIGTAILEFTADGPRQQDIDIASLSAKDNDYIVAEVSEIVHPGAADEQRRVIDDPAESGLLVTPDKTILPAGGRKVLRFVLLHEPDAEEHVYRVAVKPVIKGVEGGGKLGLKVLIGYEVLVIVRPAVIQPAFTVSRSGKTVTVTNTGNTDILFQNGQQCTAPDKCQRAPVIRAYPGQTASAELPLDQAAQYSVWDGKDTADRVVE